MANVNLLSQLAGSVAPQGQPFNAANVMAAGQQLSMGQDRLELLRAQIQAERDEGMMRQRAQEIMAAANGDLGMAAQNMMGVDPEMAIKLMGLDQKRLEFEDSAASRRATEMALQNYGNANEMTPDELGILMANPSGAIDALQGNILGGAASPEFGLNPIRTIGPDGKPTLFQLGKGGEIKPVDIPEGYNVSTGTSKVDLGTGWGIIDNSTGGLVGVLPKDIEGEEEAKIRGRTAGERATNEPQARQTFRDLKRQWGIVKEDIGKAMEEVGFLTSGWAGRLMDAIPGTPAYNLARTLDTIKANIGFDKLQSMRDNSPTGGALGQVSEFENRLLQAVQGSLEQGQSADQLRANLERIMLNLNGLEQDRAKAFQETYGNNAPGTQDAGNDPGYRRRRYNPETDQFE